MVVKAKPTTDAQTNNKQINNKQTTQQESTQKVKTPKQKYTGRLVLVTGIREARVKA